MSNTIISLESVKKVLRRMNLKNGGQLWEKHFDKLCINYYSVDGSNYVGELVCCRE